MSGDGILDAVRPRADAMSGAANRWGGVAIGVVTDNQDPDGLGRVKVTLPWYGDGYDIWARVATLMAGADRGTWFIPDPGDEVIVAFEHGDPRAPVILGALWNKVDPPPEQMATANPKRTILTGAGVRITLDDTQGAVSLLLETPGGQRVRLDDTPATVTAEDNSGNSVTLESSGVTIVAAADVNVRAGGRVSVNASMVQVTAPMSTFSGVVQADTVITNTIVAATYMPGAGNLL